MLRLQWNALQVGDRVLVQYDESTRQDARAWWVVEVEAVNGRDVVHP